MENNSLKLLVSRGGHVYRLRVIEQTRDPRVFELLHETPDYRLHFIGIMRIPTPAERYGEYVYRNLVSIYSDGVWDLDQMNAPLDAYEESVAEWGRIARENDDAPNG